MANAFRLEELDGKIGLVTFDLPDKKVNTLSQAVLQGARGPGRPARTADRPARAVVQERQAGPVRRRRRSERARHAELRQARAGGRPDRRRATSSSTGSAGCRFPTVALIDGGCLGGGTELVLTMDDRLVSTAPHTQISLPEVQIGILPGWGGTQRLPRLIGLNAAIEMICAGETVSAPEGRRPWASRSTRSRPTSWSRKGAG